MNPRFIAHALADAMRGRVISAHHYLADVEALEQAGIPTEIVRDALERKPLTTPATQALDGWDGRGPLVLHGALDTGKSHAAALWARKRRSKGLVTVWLSCVSLLGFEDLDRALARAEHAGGVVVDELGAGLGGTKGAQTKITAWLQARGQRPTVVTSNANEAQIETYLGARLVSRLKQAGELKYFPREAGLRERETESDPETGRSPRWKRERWLVDTLGYEPVDHFDPDANRVILDCRVGDGIDGAPLEQLEALAIRFGLDWAKLGARGEELAAGAKRTQTQLLDWKPPEQIKTAGAMAEIVELADEDVRREKRSAKIKGAAVGIEVLELGEAPRWASEDRQALVKLGFRVEPLGRGFVVKRRLDRDPKLAKTLSPKLKTQPLAWDYAARLCGL